jgi:uncharacterized protein with beta-barrel porin domain
MVTLKNKTKLAFAAMAAIAILMAVAVPFVGAQTVSNPNSAVASVRTMKAQGFAYQEINGQITKYQASFTLMVQPTTTSQSKEFAVTGGTVVVNGVTYTMTSGNGVVRSGRIIFQLKAQGTSPDGQAATLLLQGRYFWMGGHLYVARVEAKLETDNGNYALLMRAAIRI